MESLRSSLALWVQRNPDIDESVWVPSLEETASDRISGFSLSGKQQFREVLFEFEE